MEINLPSILGVSRTVRSHAAAVLLAFAALVPTPTSHAAEPGRKTRILTTIAPLFSWTAAIAGTNASVENLLPADVGPHSFHLQPSDLSKIAHADLIVAVGLGLEDWLDKAIKGSRSRPGPPPVLKVTDGWRRQLIHELPVLKLDPGSHTHPDEHADHDDEHGPNPHVWLDPVFARHAVSNIVAALRRADPAHADAYQARADAYQTRLAVLDADLREAIAALPSKSIVTYHDAFPYFARRYGLDLVGVVEEVPSVEPSARYLASLSKVIRARKVRVMFTEPQFNPRLVRQLSQDLSKGDLKVEFAELDVLETGPLVESFYEDAMRRNLATLRRMLSK